MCLSRLDRAARETIQVDYDDAQGYEERSGCGGAIGMAEAADLQRFIKASIESLPVKYATMLSLFYLQDLSHEEICKVTDLPLGTVKTHLFRARALLQRELLKEFQPENITA